MRQASESAAEVPLVSVGVPVFNGEAFLEDAIRSALAQTLDNLELILCDNASQDRTAEICSDYAARDPRVRYFRNPRNLGAAANYNLAFSHARGRYFKWLAHDDRMLPTFLAKTYRVREERSDARDGADEIEGGRTGETLDDDMAEEAAQRRPVAADIEKKDRLSMQVELPPTQGLEHLVERADAARQHGEGIGPLGHQPLALVHRRDDREFAEPRMGEFGIAQVSRDDADDAAAPGKRRIGEEPHQSDPSAPEDGFDPGEGEPGAEFGRCLAIGGGDLGRRAAVDAERPDTRNRVASSADNHGRR